MAAHTGHRRCCLLCSLQPHPENLWEEFFSHSYLIGLGKSKPVFQSNSFQSRGQNFPSTWAILSIFRPLLRTVWSSLHLKRYLQKSLHIVKKNYFPLWKVDPHRNSSTGITQDYLSATELMWNSSLQLCKQIDQHYRNPHRGQWWSVEWYLACFVQAVCLVLHWMGAHFLFPRATKLWDGSAMKKEDGAEET